MRCAWTAVLMISALPLASQASSNFDWLVRDFARASGVQPLHIPMFGLVRFVVAAFEPAGASELNLAVFENAHLDPERFKELADRAVGPSWKPMIRVREGTREPTAIYAQNGDHGWELLIATLDQQDATFVEVRVKPEQLMRFVDRQNLHQHLEGD
jgi:hypothetical protein